MEKRHAHCDFGFKSFHDNRYTHSSTWTGATGTESDSNMWDQMIGLSLKWCRSFLTQLPCRKQTNRGLCITWMSMIGIDVWHIAALERIGPKRPSKKTQKHEGLWIAVWKNAQLHRHLSKNFSTDFYEADCASPLKPFFGVLGAVMEIAILLYPQVNSCAAMIKSFIVGGISNQLMCSGASAL